MSKQEIASQANSSSVDELQQQMDAFRSCVHELKTEIQRAIVGFDQLIEDVLQALFSQGHVLLEGVPGLGKTYLVKVLLYVAHADESLP